MDLPYQTIVVDPPWAYPQGLAGGGANHLIGGRARTTAEQGQVVRKSLPYPSMSVNQIAALPVPALADAHCRLFLWATMRYLPDALRLLDQWNFQYRQTLVWDKTPNIPPLGGSVAPNASEFLLVAVVGKPPLRGRWPTSVIRSRKPRSEHSRKPEVFLDLVETVSFGPYLEMFARRNRLGWDTWGNEAIEHVEVNA